MSIDTYMSFIDFMKEQGLENKINEMPIISLRDSINNWKKAYDRR